MKRLTLFIHYKPGKGPSKQPSLFDTVEALGGELWVESEGHGKGCTWWVRLPTNLTATVQQVQRSLPDVSAAMVPNLQPSGKSLPHLTDVLRAGYAQAGQPYGDTEDGFQQWHQEVEADAQWLEQASRLWR